MNISGSSNLSLSVLNILTLRKLIMSNDRIDTDGVQVDDIDGSAWPEGKPPEVFAEKHEEEDSTHYEAGVNAYRDYDAEGDGGEVFSAGGGVKVDGNAEELDDSDDWVKGPQGPRGVNMDGDAGWNDGSDDWVEGVGVETHATMAKGTIGNEYIGVSGEAFGASAEAYSGEGRTKIGAQANIGAGEVRLGGEGNQIEAGLSAGAGLGAEVRHGEDSDDDGYGEWGARVEAGPVALGFKVEPGKIVDDVADAASDALDFLNPFD
jgi:hypothetical protein